MANIIRYGKQYKTLLTIWQTLLDMANAINHDYRYGEPYPLNKVIYLQNLRHQTDGLELPNLEDLVISQHDFQLL